MRFLPRTTAPATGQSVKLGSLSDQGVESEGPRPARLGRCRGEATHQVDAVGVHTAQGPPARVRVVVLAVSLHTTGFVTSGAAGKEKSGSVRPLLSGKQTDGLLLSLRAPPQLLLGHPPHSPGVTVSCPGAGAMGSYGTSPQIIFPRGQGRGQQCRASLQRTENGLGPLRALDATMFAWHWASTGNSALTGRGRMSGYSQWGGGGGGGGALTRSPASGRRARRQRRWPNPRTGT